MDHTEYNKCVDILQDKPKWSFFKDDIQNKMECLEKFKSKGTPSHIGFLMPLLTHRNESIRLKTAETINSLFGKLKSSNQLHDSLRYVPIQKADIDYYRTTFPKEIYVTLLGISSVNGSGYVREKAIRELENSKSNQAIKYILLRLGDWVKPIRKVAHSAIKSFYTAEYIESFLEELTTIDSLLRVKRVDLLPEFQSIIQFVTSTELTDEFYKKLTIDEKARLLYIKNYVNYRGINLNMARIFIGDKYFLIRKEIFKHLKEFDKSDQEHFLQILLNDVSYQVRQNALYALNDSVGKFAHTVFQLTSDDSGSIRDLARYLLRNHNQDFATVYRNRILKKEMIMGSILGLSEVSSREDLSMLKEFINHPDLKIKLACLYAISQFDLKLAKTYCLDLLTHPSNKVKNKCIDILSKTWDEEVAETTNQLYKKGNYEQRKSILRLYNKAGGWEVIPGLVLAVTDRDKSLQDLTWFFLQKWLDKALRLFTSPSEGIIRRANEYFNQIDISSIEMTSHRKRLWAEIKYYITNR